MEEKKDYTRPEWFTLRGIVDYPFLFKPKENQKGRSQYSVNIIISKDDEAQLDLIEQKQEAAVAIGAERFGWGENTQSDFRTVERDGDRERKTDTGTSKGTIYEGSIYIQASSRFAPSAIVDAKKQPITDPRQIQSGDECSIVVSFYPYDASGNRPAGIGCNLVAVQKIADGTNEAVHPRFNVDDYFKVEG